MASFLSRHVPRGPCQKKMASLLCCVLLGLAALAAISSAVGDSLYSITDKNGYGAHYDGIGGLSAGVTIACFIIIIIFSVGFVLSTASI